MRAGDEGWGLPAGRCSFGGCGIREDGFTAGGVTKDITRLLQPHHTWVLVTSECMQRNAGLDRDGSNARGFLTRRNTSASGQDRAENCTWG